MVNIENRDRWRNYLVTTDTYGTYEDRCPEYRVVAYELRKMGMRADDTVVDVGAGMGDFGRFLRENGFTGTYIPIDGAQDGTDLNEWIPDENLRADFVVCIETLEHLDNPDETVAWLMTVAGEGIVVTTPNPAVVDVCAVDPTHVTPIRKEDLLSLGFDSVFEVEFCGRGNVEEGWDTLVGLLRVKDLSGD